MICRIVALVTDRAALLGSALLLVSTLVCGPVEPPSSVRVHPLEVGFSPGFQVVHAAREQLRADFEAMAALGATGVRVDLSWAQVRARRGTSDWRATDRLVSTARRAGLEVLAVVGYEPAWSVRHDESGRRLPPDPSRFAGFARAAAQRYAGRVTAWEVWNEPNLATSWPSGPDPAAYARLVDAAGSAVHAADPAAIVLAGSLAPAADGATEISPVTFVRGLYEVVDRWAFDAVSVHPYTYPAAPAGGQSWNAFAQLHEVHAAMEAAGDGTTGLWLTEYGAPTGTSARAVSGRRQAQLLVSAVAAARELPFVDALYVYSYRDRGTRARDPEDNFGVVRADGRPKPSYAALRHALRGGR